MLKLINNVTHDEFIRLLRNENRGCFINQKHITKHEHNNFMAAYRHCYKICLKDDKPVGFIGCVNDDIRLAVPKEHRHQGIAHHMIKEAVKLWPDCMAKVKTDNMASMNAFISAGFVITKTGYVEGEDARSSGLLHLMPDPRTQETYVVDRRTILLVTSWLKEYLHGGQYIEEGSECYKSLKTVIDMLPKIGEKK